MKRALLVDADIVAFKFTSANEKRFAFDGPDEEPAIEADFDRAVSGVEEYITSLSEGLGATEVIVCLSDPDANFRKDVWPAYKGHRDYSNRPIYLQTVKNWFKTKYKTYQRAALEADDCMGILSTHSTLVKGEKIIVSEDKDLATVPGLLFNPRKDTEPRRIKPLDADRFHLWQTIVGDTCDGYPGARGVGPKSEEAQAVLAAKTVEEAWRHVLAAFARARKQEGDLPPEQQATLMARLARILRACDWDFGGKRPRLWTPPTSGGGKLPPHFVNPLQAEGPV